MGEAALIPPVYPRVCGGSVNSSAVREIHLGLSPRVRGKRSDIDLEVVEARSIPACAGEATISSRCSRERGVYPRVCGGSMVKSDSVKTIRGLSPRVRGKLRQDDHIGGGGRSIPACAGEAFIRLSPVSGWGVYPRVCGGSLLCGGVAAASRGLSPRVRGKRVGAGVNRHNVRSIPACAGEA